MCEPWLTDLKENEINYVQCMNTFLKAHTKQGS